MNSTAILRSITTSTSRYEERADRVIVQRVLSTRVQTLADARENTTAFFRLAGGRPRQVLVDMRIVRALQASARDHYADPELAALCAAVAFLVASPGSRQLSQHIMSSYSGPVPMAQFAEEAEAIAWLHRATRDQPTFAGSAAL